VLNLFKREPKQLKETNLNMNKKKKRSQSRLELEIYMFIWVLELLTRIKIYSLLSDYCTRQIDKCTLIAHIDNKLLMRQIISKEKRFGLIQSAKKKKFIHRKKTNSSCYCCRGC
jgi:hypothetical protein